MLLPLARFLNWTPRAVEVVPVVRVGESGPPLSPGEGFRVVTWNIQYAGTRRHHFFYDGGPAVHVPETDVTEALAAIVAVVLHLDADLVLLQEVDRGSDRTGRVDELATILARVPMPAWVGTPIHRSRYIPHPRGEPLGAIDLHQVILSRRALRCARRFALSPLKESPTRRFFNLKRALLVAESGAVSVATTHLSAFSRGDGTMPRQVAEIQRWIDERGDQPWILGGDFNLLPPGDSPGRLGAGGAEYADPTPPIAPLLARARSVIPPADLLDPVHRTYLPPGATAPDRVLDYLFVSPHFKVRRAWVEPVPIWLSDHWPLVADLEW